ncbi:acyl-CoA synthetase [Streptomyces sp. NPDC055078]
MAERHPDRAAITLGESGRTVTYAELDAGSNRVAHALAALGVAPGDGVAVMLPNVAEFGEIWWAAMRSGLYFTPVNWHLTASEIRFIVQDCGAKVLFFHQDHAEAAAGATEGLGIHRICVTAGSDRVPGTLSYEEVVAGLPATPIAREYAGAPMFYSSGTTGKPKGIRPRLTMDRPGDSPSLMRTVMEQYGLTDGARYLCTGPLYHSSPALWSFGQHTIGGTAVIMPRFDAEAALRLIESEAVSHSQWVPTMFSRMLKLPEEVRHRYDLSSHRAAFHAAAPCPVDVKRRMIDWWGEILVEFYAATEGGSTVITSKEWLEHPGSVGRAWAGGGVHILDPGSREELPAGSPGLVYFTAMANHRFEYHNDAAKTAETYHGDMVTAGDIGYLDAEGYLYLTDRSSDMIISGGVNIYPREVEEVLLAHPAVTDVAVFGIPNTEFGEEVLAVVQPADSHDGGPELGDELIAYCREHLAGFKVPRRVDFVTALPRDPNGKLYKRRLRDEYWQGHTGTLV